VTDLLRTHPVVGILGARQVGKTTLAAELAQRSSGPSTRFDLEDPDDLARLQEPKLALAGLRGLVIIDEIQYAPSLLRHIKVRIDQDRSAGRFLLTGSQIFPLMQGVSESLAGRCALVSLHTLSRTELLAAGRGIGEDRYVFVGGYPELHVGADPDLWFPAYLATYLERDVRNVLRVADLPEFNRFMRACALIFTSSRSAFSRSSSST